jgi:hypothetical protein
VLHAGTLSGVRALAFAIIAAGHVAAAERPRLVPKRAAIEAFVPGMAESEARRRARDFGCDDVNPVADQLTCVEGDDEQVLEAWALRFERGRLISVEYAISVELTRLDASSTRAARNVVDGRAAELETAADAAGGTKSRARISSTITSGKRTVWRATRSRASKLQLAVWDDRGKEAEYCLAFEIVAPDGEFAANALFEDAH